MQIFWGLLINVEREQLIMRQKLHKRIQALEKHILSKRNLSLPHSLKTDKINPISSLSTSFSLTNSNANNMLSEPRKYPKNLPQTQIQLHSNSMDSKNSNLIGKQYFNLDQYKARLATQNMYNIKQKLKLPNLTPTLIKYFDKSYEKKKLVYDQSEHRIKKRAFQKVQEIYEKEQKIVGQKIKHIERIRNRISVLDKIYLDKQKLKKKYSELNMSQPQMKPFNH